MGVTDKAVSKWERDLSFSDVSSIPKLAEILGVSVDKLMQVKAESKEEPIKKRIMNYNYGVLRDIVFPLHILILKLKVPIFVI